MLYYAGFYRLRLDDNIRPAAFSAIIKVGEFVFPDVMVGITDASAILSPDNP